MVCMSGRVRTTYWTAAFFRLHQETTVAGVVGASALPHHCVAYCLDSLPHYWSNTLSHVIHPGVGSDASQLTDVVICNSICATHLYTQGAVTCTDTRSRANLQGHHCTPDCCKLLHKLLVRSLCPVRADTGCCM